MNIKIKPFAGEIGQLSKLVKESWIKLYKKRNPFLLWEEELFDWRFNTRSDSRQFSFLAYENDKLIGCSICFPADYVYAGHSLKVGQLCWVTVAPEYQRQNHAVSFQLVGNTVKAVVARNFDMIIGFSSLKHTSFYWNKFYSFLKTTYPHYPYAGILGEFRYFLKVLKTAVFNNWCGGDFLKEEEIIWPSPEISRKVRLLEPADIEECRQRLNSLQTKLSFTRYWSSSELLARLYSPPNVYSFVLETEGEIKGIINCLQTFLCGGDKRLPIVYLANLYLDEKLTGHQVADFFNAVFWEANKTDAAAICIGGCNYCNGGSPEEFGFFELPDTFKVFCCNFNSALDFSFQDRIYLDDI